MILAFLLSILPELLFGAKIALGSATVGLTSYALAIMAGLIPARTWGQAVQRTFCMEGR